MKARYALLYPFIILGILAVVNSAPAQGTSFIYQGCLNDTGGPANGNYDLQFTLYDAATNGNSPGTTVTNPATGVTNGLFTVTLDFGTGVFAGQPLWLEIGARTNGGQGSFSILSPRQPFTSTPYAITAANLSGTLPTSQLTGSLPASQLSGAIPVASVVGAQPANINLATNLTYTNYQGVWEALLPVTIGRTYIYYPTQVGGIFDGSYVLAITGTNYTDANASFIDLSGGASLLLPFQTNQMFVATQNTVTFVGQTIVGGPVTDTLFDLANVTVNGTVNGIGQFNGMVNGTGQFNGNLQGTFSGTITNSVFSGVVTNSTISGVITNSTLAGDAQGGAVTNIDAAVINLADLAGNLASAFAQITNAGGTIYLPTNVFVTAAIPFNTVGASVAADPSVRLRGNGPSLTDIIFYGANTNLFDQFNAAFGTRGLDLQNIHLHAAILSGGMADMGYVSAPGASGTPFWQNDQFDYFLIGASMTQSGMQLDGLDLEYNGIGLILAPYSDGALVNADRVIGQVNAGIESDSRGNRIFVNAASDNIDVLIGAGAGDLIQYSAEGTTNAGIAIGYPDDWVFPNVNGNPFNTQYAGSQLGNATSIGAIVVGYGYAQGQSVNYANPFAYDNAALIKVFNTNFFGGALVTHENLASSSMPALISYTTAGDIAPYEFEFTYVGNTNLAIFSDGTAIPSEDGYHVGVNDPDLEFTKNMLEYSRDTNGDLYAAGNITAGGVLNAASAQVASLSVTGAGANSLLGTDAGDNVTGIGVGAGLTLSGGTLSLSLLGGTALATATSVNTYTSDHVATAQDDTILVSGAGLTVTLPDAAALGAGRSYVIKLIAGSTATVAATNSQTIDGSASYTLSAQYKYVTVQSDGAQWWILGNN